MKLLIKALVAGATGGLLLTAAACGGDKAVPATGQIIAFNDYEAVAGWWSPVPATLTRELAHSGQYAVKVSPGQEFGLGYRMPLGSVSAQKPRKIRLDAWAYMTDARASARLGLQLFDPSTSKEVFGDGLDYVSTIHDYKKWVPISKLITLPPNVTSAQEMRVFLWLANAQSPAYIDDLRISLVE